MSDTASSVQKRYILTDAQMQRIVTIKPKDASKGAVDFYIEVAVTTWKCILGEDAFKDENTPISCTAHAIPQSQWKVIADHLIHSVADDARACVAMEWVNTGPSSYQDKDNN